MILFFGIPQEQARASVPLNTLAITKAASSCMVGDAELGAVSFGALRRIQRAKILGACT